MYFFCTLKCKKNYVNKYILGIYNLRFLKPLHKEYFLLVLEAQSCAAGRGKRGKIRHESNAGCLFLKTFLSELSKTDSRFIFKLFYSIVKTP